MAIDVNLRAPTIHKVFNMQT